MTHSLRIASSCGRSEGLITHENEPFLIQGSFPSPFSDEDLQGGEGPKITASKAQIGDPFIPRCSRVRLRHGHPRILEG